MSSSQRRLSTALSDFVLAATSFYCAIVVYRVSPYIASGFCVVATAACFGVLKFGVVFPNRHATVIRIHALFTWLASIIGLPLIAAGFSDQHHRPSNSRFHLSSGAVAFVLSLLNPPMEKGLAQLVSSLAVLGILLVTLMSSNYSGALGALAFAVAGGVNQLDTCLGLRGVDWFHYILALANLLFVYGLVG